MCKLFFKICNQLTPILNEIEKNGGIAYMVGGVVRDLVLKQPIKDMDIEVHQLTTKKLESILKKFGHVALVGKKFGVFRLKKFDVDWSLPRKDSKGRKPIVKIDPYMGIEAACKRRDLTMNAMAIDLNFVCKNIEKLKKISGSKLINSLKIIDPYGGLNDISNNQLCAVDKKLFLDDPLRFFRVMQFTSRFEMCPDKALTQICRTMNLFDMKSKKPLAQERIFEEIKKLLLKSKQPSIGFRWLLQIDRLNEIFPEIYSMVGVMQNPKYHPEGDVFEHTMQTLDAAANLEFYNKSNVYEEKFLIMLAALCHDLGKPAVTDKNLHAYGHANAGEKICGKFLRRITNQKTVISAVKKLVNYHCTLPILIAEKAGIKSYKRLAIKLAPEVAMRQLALVCLADKRGRNNKSQKPFKKKYANDFKAIMEKIREAHVEHKPEAPILLGRHMIDAVECGPEMGKLLKQAYEIQISEGIKDVDKLKRRVLYKA